MSEASSRITKLLDHSEPTYSCATERAFQCKRSRGSKRSSFAVHQTHFHYWVSLFGLLRNTQFTAQTALRCRSSSYCGATITISTSDAADMKTTLPHWQIATRKYTKTPLRTS